MIDISNVLQGRERFSAAKILEKLAELTAKIVLSILAVGGKLGTFAFVAFLLCWLTLLPSIGLFWLLGWL